MAERCCSCIFFEEIQGIFGCCLADHRNDYRDEVFSSNKACEAHITKAPSDETYVPSSLFVDPSEYMGQPPMGMFFGKPCLIEQPKQKEDKIPWQNPLFKQKRPIRKVISFKEAGEKLLKRKKLNGIHKGGL